MSYVVTESKGIRITRITRGDDKDYWLCKALGRDIEEKCLTWDRVAKFIELHEKGERV